MAFKTLDQCYQIQDQLFTAFESEEDNGTKAKLALAWERVVDRQRILRGKPLPGMLKPDNGTGKLKAKVIDSVLPLEITDVKPNELTQVATDVITNSNEAVLQPKR